MKDIVILKVTDLIKGNLCISTGDGQIVHDRIFPSLKENQPMCLSFSGVEVLISPFLNAAIGRLYSEFTKEDIEKKLTFSDLTPEHHHTLARVKDNAVRYFEKKETYDKAWEDELDDKQK